MEARSPISGARAGSSTARPRRPPRFRALSDFILTGRSALPALTAGVSRARAEASRAHGVSSTGSWSFRKSFFDATATACRTPDSTPSSATRPGTCCEPTPARPTRGGRAAPSNAPVSASPATPASISRSPAATPTATSSSSSARWPGPARRPHRPRAAVRIRHRSWKRPLRRRSSPVRRGRNRRLREPARRLSHPPKRAFPAPHGDSRPRRRRRCLPARGIRPRRARADNDGSTAATLVSGPSDAALLRHLSGDDLTIPDFRAPTDLAIAERAAALFPPLGNQDGWQARFGRELNATEDRAAFNHPAAGCRSSKGKRVEPFRVQLDAASAASPPSMRALLVRASTPAARVSRRGQRHQPDDADRRHAARRVRLDAHPLLPAHAAAVRAQHFLCGLFNSFVVNYLVRLRVTTHVTTAIVERLPVPLRGWAPESFDGGLPPSRRRLSRRNHREGWAQTPGPRRPALPADGSMNSRMS